MAGKTLEILMSGLDISGYDKTTASSRLITAELLWPRPLVAQKTTVKTVKLAGGIAPGNLPWRQRILFKENVEYRFGLNIKISESLSAAAIDSFFRFFGSRLFGLAGDIAEGMLPGVAGDAAAAPMDYGKKVLGASSDPKILLEGGIDLDAADINAEPLELKIPLLTLKDSYTTKRGIGPKSTVIRRQLNTPAGTPAGVFNITVYWLDHGKKGK